MITCYIGLGSNLGNRQYNIEAAIRKIRGLINTRLGKVSTIIESSPQGGQAQGNFLNCVVEVQTTLSPYELLSCLQEIEQDLGRIRKVKNEPRLIDLDILLYGSHRINEESLCIPHPRMLEREFVIHPLEEIAPEILNKFKKRKAKSRKKQ